MYVLGNFRVFFFPGLCVVNRISVKADDELTETINIIASLSRESSLHLLVKIGSPMGTKTKPGGGFASSTTYTKG